MSVHSLGCRGMTLIEVLVALAIVAISLTAGLHATGALTHLADRQSNQWLAQLCADNALIATRLSPQLPPLGESISQCEQAQYRFTVRLLTSATPNAGLRRVQARVEALAGSDVPVGTALLDLSTVIGRY